MSASVHRGLATPAACRAEAATSQAGLTFETVSDREGLDALRPEWTALFARCGEGRQVFQGAEWLAVWESLYLGRHTRAAIVTGRRGGRLVLLWPLVIESRLGFRILTGMGEPLSQYSDALFGPEIGRDDEEAALDHVLGLPADIVMLRRVRADARIAPVLRRRFGGPQSSSAAPVVDLEGVDGIEAFDRRFSGKQRSNRLRRRRRLEERGPLSFDHIGPTSEARHLVETALAFKQDWARQRGLVAPALWDRRFENFFLAACEPAFRVPGLRVSTLRRGTEVLGIEISILCGRHLFGHVLAPNPEHASAGVGGVLAWMTIRNAIAEGYASVDLLAPADPYKLEWSTGTVEVGEYRIPLSGLGRAFDRLWLGFARETAIRLAHTAGRGAATLRRHLRPT